jgi:hypothetical protein
VLPRPEKHIVCPREPKKVCAQAHSRARFWVGLIHNIQKYQLTILILGSFSFVPSSIRLVCQGWAQDREPLADLRSTERNDEQQRFDAGAESRA